MANEKIGQLVDRLQELDKVQCGMIQTAYQFQKES